MARSGDLARTMAMMDGVAVKEFMPSWLRDWDLGGRFPVARFFASRVVYYPGSGTDGQPVKFFGARHAAHCFVYVDYGISRDHVVGELAETGHPFAGYRSVGRIEVSERDLTPNGWVPHLNEEQSSSLHHAYEAPYAFFEILERRPGFGAEHGPQRLVILFLCADGVAAYDALVCQPDAAAPFAVVLQDHGFGGNWTSFGAGGHLELLARQTSRLPQLLLVASNTVAWEGYSPIDGATADGGGMDGLRRQLWRRN